MTTTEMQGDYTFKAEIRQLLHILVHSLYQEREIFLRELISNASDALTRLHFETLTNQQILDPESELAVHVDPRGGEEDEKWLVVRDSGVGMTSEELARNLGTIAQSGAREFLEQLQQSGQAPGDMIGQFGVGFYSVFMVADEVRVISRSYLPDAEAAMWVSRGDDYFRIEPADKEDRGTEIHIKLKEDADEFAQPWKLRQVIKKHSDFIGFPIYVGDEQANQQESLWRKSPAEVTEEDYRNFYQQMTMDFEEPLVTTHFSSDAPVSVRALLFIPARREKSVLSTRREPGVKLYSHNVLIQEYCTDLLPRWLEFADGVVDSEDLPLNVSRETVQNNRLMRQLGIVLRKRIVRELRTVAKDDPEKYARLWGEYQRVFKEGLTLDPAAKEEMLPLFRFESSASDGKLTSLEEYVERMPEEQEEIYYVLGDDARVVARSPHLDPFKARNLEVLYWVDPLDAFIAPIVTDFKDKKLRNIDDAGLELPELEGEEADDSEPAGELADADFNRLVGRFVTTLGNRIIEVRPSRVLKDSPVRLVSPEDSPNREMERISRYLDRNYEVPKKILEVNRRHSLIVDLAGMVAGRPDDPFINLAIEQLYDGALVQEGLHPNPADMLPRIQQILETAAREINT